MGTEDLIRDALRARAEQTPPPGHVLAALHRPRRSRKPLFLAITAATAVAAVAVVATTVGRPSAEAPPAAGSTLPTTSAPTTTTTPAVPQTLGYRPTWVPDGMIERTRWVDQDGNIQRGWSHRVPSGQSGTPMMELRIPHRDETKQVLRQEILGATGDSQVVIGGARGVITDPGQDATAPDARVVVNPEPGTYIELVLFNAPDVRAAALRVAESLRPDPTSSRPVLSIGGSTAFDANADGAGEWGVSTTGEIDGVGYSATLRTTPSVPLKGGPGVAPVPVTARGVPGEYIGEQNGYLRLTLGPRQHLMVAGNGPDTASAEALIAAAEAMVIDPNPDMAWATS